MKRILEHLFQGDIVFPMEAEEERRFGTLGDEVQKKLEQLEGVLEEDALHQVKDYLELLENFHNWERQLAFENGFLLATSLWLEVSDKLGRLQL